MLPGNRRNSAGKEAAAAEPPPAGSTGNLFCFVEHIIAQALYFVKHFLKLFILFFVIDWNPG